MRKLRISNENKSEINNLNQYSDLEDLTIIKCGLTKVPNLSNLVSLKTLSLHNNNIDSISGFDNLENLENLSLGNNSICELDGLKGLNKLKNLKSLSLYDNKISKLDITYCPPNLEKLSLDDNPIKKVISLSGFNNHKCSLTITRFRKDNFNEKNFTDFINIAEKAGFKIERGIREYPDKNEYDVDIIDLWRPPPPSKTFRVNKYISLKLNYKNKTVIYINDKKFKQCHYLLLDIPINEIKSFNKIIPVDEISDKLDHSLEPINETSFPPNTEFWGHCSNLQVWAENKYDTRLLHRNLAFPLLRKLTEVGDPIAKRVFKEEIAKRYKSGYPSVVHFLKKEGYLNYLTKDELIAIQDFEKE